MSSCTVPPAPAEVPAHSLVWQTQHLIHPNFGVKPKITLLSRTCRQAGALLIASP